MDEHTAYDNYVEGFPQVQVIREDFEHNEPQYGIEDNDEPIEAFIFAHGRIEEEGHHSNNARTVVTDYLPEVLRAFEEFLRESGFEYVQTISAECGDNVVWSSAD